MDKMEFRQHDLPNRVRRGIFREFKFKILKRGEDKTQAVFTRIEALPKLTPYIPVATTIELAYHINALINVYASLPVSFIIEEQFFISFESQTGNSAYLTLDNGVPFLAFENLPSVMIPLGDSDHTKKLLDTTNIEYIFLGELLHQWSFQEQPSLVVQEQTIAQSYWDFAQNTRLYSREIQTALDSGVITEDAGSLSSFRMTKDFSWMEGHK